MCGCNKCMMKLFLLVFIEALVVASVEAFVPVFGLRTTRLAPRAASALAYKVTIVEGDKETVLDVEGDMTVLEASIDAGLELDYDCQMGVCLTCPTRVVSGRVSQDGGTLDDGVVADGYALTCVTRPLEDCVIKVVNEDELVSAQFAGRPSGALA